jgi:hypothetical protein
VIVAGQLLAPEQVGTAVNVCELSTATLADCGLIDTPVRTAVPVPATVIIVELPFSVPLSVALTKMPTVPPVLPALNLSVLPLPLSEPSVVLDKAQTNVMPEAGHVELHFKVAVNVVALPAETEGDVGDRVTEVRVTPETVITVFPFTSFPLSVAFTNMPTVPETVDAVNVTEEPAPLSVPSEVLVRDQVYSIPEEGHEGVHVGLAEKEVWLLAATMGKVGLIDTEVKVGPLTVMIVEAP